MKISVLIEKLTDIKNQHGDVEIGVLKTAIHDFSIQKQYLHESDYNRVTHISIVANPDKTLAM